MSDDKPEDLTPPQAAGDKPPSDAPAEPLKGEVSRTDAAGAGVSAAPVGPSRTSEPAPKPENPAAATTATTAETSSATGQPAEAAAAVPKPAAAPKPAAPAAAAAGKAAAPAAGGAAAAKPPAAKPEPKVATAPSAPAEPAPPANVPIPPFVAALQQALPDAVTAVSYWVGDWSVVVPAARLLEVATFLRDTAVTRFDYCSDVTATDWPPRPQRFDVIYCLYSTVHRHRIRVKVRAAETEPVPSVTGVWPAANWLEREVYDLFGVNFVGHPDRRRILMPDEWQGHPQRKDYPLEGPGELLMENPLDWLQLKVARDTADIE
jgi:NADH/F420H2 dehydrogenase subunit C